jgi:cytosine/adenosine deaminase-related metal-dependent hydrolase
MTPNYVTITKKLRINLKIIKADFILTCNDKFEIIEDGAVVFDAKILAYGKSDEILNKYPSCEVIEAPQNSCLMPGLINPHVHLEFSSNKTTLAYGDFITWLNSVIQKRDDLLTSCNDDVIEEQLSLMLQSGTTTLGAISSFGGDFEACKSTPQRVVFFAEVLGSRPDAVDILFNDFQSRLRVAEDNADDKLIPAISIHSPYSTHPILARNALDIARKFGYSVSTHFMESVAERNWLDSASGDFYNFFANFSPNAKPLCNASEYIDLFKGCHTLFTHCVQATKKELEQIKGIGGYVTHCPVSNRLLGIGRLKIEDVDKTLLNLGTDGLSSNISLSLWDEMRMALMLHHQGELNTKLAPLLLKMATLNAAKALNVNAGEIKEERYADLLVCTLPDVINSKEDLALNLILHVKEPHQIYIQGKKQ